MISLQSSRGTTLVEALVASSLLVVLVAGVAHLLLSARQSALQATILEAATLVAQDRIERLRAVPSSFDMAGEPVEATDLAASPPESLVRTIAPYADALDVSGQLVDLTPAAQARFVRRWAVTDLGSGEPTSHVIEVCVFQSPAESGAAPLVCLATIRTRRP